MSTRSVVYNLQLNSNVTKVLQESEAHAKKLDGAMWQLQKSLAAFGVGLGAHFMKDFAMDMIEGATEMERAMLRIKNVSENPLQGLKNQFFIRGEVDKFKIDLQDATDAYGDFLTMVRGSEDLTAGQIRKLHDELLTISKITGLGNGQMDAAIRNLGKMLEEGALEGKHLKPLSYQLSGLMPYIARELGADGAREVSNMITSGIGKMNISSTVLADAIEKYSNDLLPKLDESLQTIESHTNDAKNAWLEFKNELVLDNKGDLNQFIDSLRDGAKWLTENKDELIEVGGAVANIAEFYIKWRLALLALQAPSMILGFINGELGRMDAILGTTTTSTLYQTTAQNSLNSSISLTVSELDASLIAREANAKAMATMVDIENKSLLVTNQMILSAEKLGYAWYEAGGAFSKLAVDVAELLTESKQLEAAFVKGAEDAEIAWAGYFKEMDIGMKKLMEQQMVVNGESLAMSGARTSAISGTSSVLSGLGKGFVSGAMNVFMVGMAADLIADLAGWYSKSRLTGKEMGLLESLDNGIVKLEAIFSMASIYGVREAVKTQSESYNKNESIKRENNWVDAVNQKLSKLDRSLEDVSNPLNWFNGKLNSKEGTGFNPLGTEVYNAIKKVDQEKKTNYINEIYGERNVIMNQIDSTNIGVLEKAKSKGIIFQLKPIGDDTEEERNGTHKGSHKLDKIKNERIKGNSSHYITINIDEMNGMNNPTFTVASSYDMGKIEKQVGDALVKVLTGVVNDSQLIAK